MKEGWKMVKLGEVASYNIGLTYKPCDVVSGCGTIVLRSSNIQNSKLDLEDIVRVKTTIKDELYVKKGDILMCSRNGSAKLVGKVALIDEIKEPMTYGTFMTVIRSEYNSYLFYYFHSNLFKDGMRNSENPMINQITKYMLNEVVLPLPPLEEQHRIVGILDAAFAKIDALKANAEANLANAKALFQQVLAQELQPKEGWVDKKLGEFAYMKAGDFVKASDIHTNSDEGLFPCYGGNGLRGYVSEPNQEGDYCLIGRQGALCGCIHRVSGIYRTTEHAVIVKPYEEIPTTLVYYLLVSLDLNKYATGAAQPGLSVKNISENVIISIPPLSEQHRIVSTLDTLSEKCRRLEQVAQQTIRECDALKQSILRQALVGNYKRNTIFAKR